MVASRDTMLRKALRLGRKRVPSRNPAMREISLGSGNGYKSSKALPSFCGGARMKDV